VAFSERPQDAIREDILQQQPPNERASRLWDGSAPELAATAEPNGFGGGYEEAAPLPSRRSRLDIDYSDGTISHLSPKTQEEAPCPSSVLV
jgi:hypothetical protein